MTRASVGAVSTAFASCLVLACRGANEPGPAPATSELGPPTSPTSNPKPAQPRPADGPFAWPELMPRPEAFELEIPPTGPLDPIVFVIRQPFADAWARWRPTLEAAGLHLDDLSEDPHGLTATLCAGDCEEGPRFALMLTSYGEKASHGWLIPAPAREQVALPGACEPIPDTRFTIIEHRSGHGFDDYLQQQIDIEQDYRWSFSPSRKLDLDRDAHFDVMVPVPPPPGTCPKRVEWELWVTRGGCGHHVGHIVGDPGAVWRPPSVELEAGLVVLPTRREPRGPAEGALDLVYVFDGAAYQERERTQRGARCDVHPADCDPLIRSTCRFVEPDD